MAAAMESGDYLADANDYGGYEDLVSLVPNSPTPQALYRCPVSTPSNISRPDKQFRKKPISKALPLQQKYNKAFIVRTSGLGRHDSHDNPNSPQKNVEYYFVDKSAQYQEEALTNSFWLKSLCAQPVDEILGKYRRKSDVRRTILMWSKTFSTPGEQAILSAWETNTTLGCHRPVKVSRKLLFKGLTLSQEVKVSSAPSVRHNATVADGVLPPPTSTPPIYSTKEVHSSSAKKSIDNNAASSAKYHKAMPSIKRPLFNFLPEAGKARKGHHIVQTKKYMGTEHGRASLHKSRLDEAEIISVVSSPVSSIHMSRVQSSEVKNQKAFKLPQIGRKDN